MKTLTEFAKARLEAAGILAPLVFPTKKQRARFMDSGGGVPRDGAQHLQTAAGI